jgi:hypothetical protein
MAQFTITEALAEIRTLEKRVGKKRQFILDNLVRQEQLRDPLLKGGGQEQVILQEMQSMGDLLDRQERLRLRINESNLTTMIDISGAVKSVAGWIIWKREIAPGCDEFMDSVSDRLRRLRDSGRREGIQLVKDAEQARPVDYIVNFDEQKLAQNSEKLEDILGKLDGAMSLKNATTFIESE